MSRRSLTVLVALAGLGVSGYTIAPKARVHEWMTRAAHQCFQQAEVRGEDLKDCTWPAVADSLPRDIHWFGPLERPDDWEAYPTLEKAVAWPDDPTRQIELWGIFKFGANMLGNCSRLARRAGLEANTIDHGLLCNSHFGEMQFLHAMAARSGEPAVQTHELIERWATFLYQVASGQVPDKSLDAPYCSVFAGDDILSRVMRPDSTSTPCDLGGNNPWTLVSLFTFRCINPLSSTFCWRDDSPRRHTRSRIIATGALLHLIQDSYSQSHCQRGNCGDGWTGSGIGKKVPARIECRPITMFTTYRNQKRHDHADRMPAVSTSCADSMARTKVDDPVTASAKVLWHIKRRDPTEKFLRDLAMVFGHREDHWTSTAAGPGRCFYKHSAPANTQEP